MNVYYIAMEIYVIVCIIIISHFYCLCITNMSHHSSTMNFTYIILKLFETKISIPFTILFHETLHSYKKLFLSSESVFKGHKHSLIY
jgi:hypothetical protein